MDLNKVEYKKEKYGRCWCCDSLCLKNTLHYRRIEEHHILGRGMCDLVVPLCILCHDFVDRMSLSDVELLGEVCMNVMEEIGKMPKGLKYTRLLMLKMLKLEGEMALKDKQMEGGLRGE